MDHDDEPEDTKAERDLDHHAEWCKDSPMERALEETDQTGKYTTPRYVVQEGEPSMYGRSEVVVDTATGRELCDAWCNEAPEDATVHRAFRPLLDEINTLAAELTRLRALPVALLASFDARAKALDLAAERGSAGPCALTESGRESMRAAAISIRECASTVRFLQQHPEMLEATDADG